MDTLDLLVILDRSGSMQTAKDDHEGGLRSFVQDQRGLDGDVRFTLVQFDTESPCEIVYDRTPLAQVTEIRLIPRGGTPLLDAMGKAVSHLRAKIHDTDPVVVMVITDGQENSSYEWTRDRVKSLVVELESQGWKFLFLGANVDAFAEARSLGIPMAGTANFNNAGGQHVNAAYQVTSGKLRSARMASGVTGQSVGASVMDWMTYDDEDRAKMGGTPATPTAGVPKTGTENK